LQSHPERHESTTTTAFNDDDDDDDNECWTGCGCAKKSQQRGCDGH
jgi:hypothetical protein